MLQEEDFPKSNLITADHAGKNRFLAELQRGSRTPLEQSTLACELRWSFGSKFSKETIPLNLTIRDTLDDSKI
jgi:hypothetical protein